jgi:hypothetical protein
MCSSRPFVASVAVAMSVAIGLVAAGAVDGNATGGCARRDGCAGSGGAAGTSGTGGARPPAIGVTAGRVSYVIASDGRVRRTANPGTLLPRAAIWFPATGTWYMLERGHLIVGLGSRRLWRSRGTFGSRWQLGVIVAGPRAVAYQHDHELWIAPFGGAERPVATQELPLGWTAGGLYTYRYRDRALLLRSDTGALVKVIGRRPLGSDYQVQDGNLYFVRRGALICARGASVRRLGSLSAFGVSAAPSLAPLGRYVELMDDDRVVVVRPDGSVFASTPLPTSRGHTENISSALAVAPDGSAVAFAAAAGQWRQTPSHPSGVHGTETVYLLEPGARAAVPVHTEDVVFRACERGGDVQWRGSWLLYSNSEGNLVAIDTSAGGRSIDLTGLGRRLPGTSDGFTAYWSAEPPVL